MYFVAELSLHNIRGLRLNCGGLMKLPRGVEKSLQLWVKRRRIRLVVVSEGSFSIFLRPRPLFNETETQHGVSLSRFAVRSSTYMHVNIQLKLCVKIFTTFLFSSNNRLLLLCRFFLDILLDMEKKFGYGNSCTRKLLFL